MFMGKWFFLPQEHFSSEFHLLCQLLGRSGNICCLTLSKDGQIADTPFYTAVRLGKYSGLGLVDVLFTSVTQGLEDQGIRAPVGRIMTRLVHIDVARM